MRFIWFGGFSQGLLGSSAYVASLSATDLGRLRAMFHIAPIGSPNFVRFVFDGDNSTVPSGVGVISGPAGSGEIERILDHYFATNGLTSAPTELTSAADYAAFAGAGIPVGGLFSGRSGLKTAEETSLFGGTAGIAYDPCTNLACDTFANVSLSALESMSGAAAHATLLLSRKNFSKTP
jgi:Zn-dependent M28 family amino/carboxypeptidase